MANESNVSIQATDSLNVDRRIRGGSIHFNGLKLVKDGDRYYPEDHQMDTVGHKKNKNVFEFVNMLDGYEAENRRIDRSGPIVYADDQFIH